MTVKTCDPVPEWLYQMPEPPTADGLVPGKTTRGELADKIGDMEKDRRLARSKLKAVAVHQAPCR